MHRSGGRRYTISRRRTEGHHMRGPSVSAVEAKIHIIGVGSDGLAGLTTKAKELISTADLVLGSDHAMKLLPEPRAELMRIGSDLPDVVRALEANLGRKRIVVVASGDPLFYGVARYLC